MDKDLQQQPGNCIKIVFFGPESTGKTTLAKQLAEHYQTQWVPEFARDYLQRKYDDSGIICEEKDLIPIAIGQIDLENKLAVLANKVLFCDTNVLQTYCYAQVYYNNFKNERLEQAVQKHQYTYYFLTDIDVPWEADDLRDKPNERQAMFNHFERALQKNNLPYTQLSGSLNTRLELAKKQIDKLLSNDQ